MANPYAICAQLVKDRAKQAPKGPIQEALYDLLFEIRKLQEHDATHGARERVHARVSEILARRNA